MMPSTPQPGVPLVLRRKGFTLLELLVVMAIIAILITILILGVSSMSKSSHEKATRTDMENLKSLMVEATNQGAMDKIYNLYSPTPTGVGSPPYYPNGHFLPAQYPAGAVIPVPGDVRDGSPDRMPTFSQPTPPIPSNEVARTWLVMNLLHSAGTNADMLNKLPSDALMSAKEANSQAKLATPPAAPIPLDGWGNPMIFVPGGGIQVTVTDPAGPGKVGMRTVVAPDGKGFWASAGPDGIFTDNVNAAGSQKPFGDDNIYSFEN